MPGHWRQRGDKVELRAFVGRDRSTRAGRSTRPIPGVGKRESDRALATFVADLAAGKGGRTSMPGIGPRTGSRILAEIGDGTRFVDGDKLASYTGLAPVTRQAGKSINGESKSRRKTTGSKIAMFLAAFASLRAPGPKRSTTENEPKTNATTPSK